MSAIVKLLGYYTYIYMCVYGYVYGCECISTIVMYSAVVDRIESNRDKPKENTIQDISAQLKAQSHTDRDIKKKE